MPDYNLGRARGTIRIDYDESGAKEAREDVQDIGDESTRSAEKVDKSSKQSSRSLEELATSARRASQSLEVDHSSYDQLGAAVKKLEKDVSAASASALTARAKLQAAEEALNEVRKRSGATAKEVASAERDVQRSQQSTVNSVNRLNISTKALVSARQRLANMPKPDLTPDTDSSAMQQFINHLKQIQANTAKSSSLLNTFSGRVKIMVGGVAIAAPQIAGLGVALVQLAGLAGVAAGALASLGAVAGTVATGMSGIGEAFKAAGAQAKAAGGSAGASAKAQKAAARAIEDAKRSLIDAEQSLRDVQQDAARSAISAAKQVVAAQRDLIQAQREAVRAQLDLSKARQQAVRDLEDMQAALTGGALDERQAVLDLTRAQQELAAVQADPTANANDIAQATLNLEKQEFALQQLQKSNQRLTVDQAASAAAGVAGSDSVINAQDGVRNATDSVRSAQESLAEAQQNVRQTQIDSARAISDAVQGIIDAQRNLAEAYADAGDAGAAAGAKLNDALANLSPNARAFVEEVLSLKGAWDKVKRTVQDNLFEGLAAEVKPLASIWLPLLEKGMGDVATGLNGMVKETIAYLKTTEAQANVKNIFDNTSLAMQNMRGIIADLVAALLDIASVGSDFLPDIATGAADAARRFREFISAAKESGALRKWMQDAMGAAKELWDLLKNLGGIIKAIFTGLNQDGTGALGTFAELTAKVREFLESAEGQEALGALGAALRAIGGATGKIFLSFLKTVSELIVDLSPLLVAMAETVGTLLAGAWAAFGAVLGPVAELLGFLAPVLGPIAGAIYATNAAVNAAKVAWAALNTTMKANPFILIAGLIIGLVILIIQNWDTIGPKLMEIWTWIKDAAASVWGWINDVIVQPIKDAIQWIKDVWTETGNDIKQTWTDIQNWADRTWSGIGRFITDHLQRAKDKVGQIVSGIVKFFMDLPGKVLNFLKSLPGKLANWAGDLINGIIRGLGDMAYKIWQKLKDIVSRAWDSVLSFFGISSPSKLAADAGQNIVMGLVSGMEKMTGAAVDAAATMAAEVGNELTGASGTLAKTVNFSANTSGLPDNFGMTAALQGPAGSLASATRGGDGATASRTVIIEKVDVYVQGNLDPTNPVGFRQTMVRLKDELRSLDKEYQ